MALALTLAQTRHLSSSQLQVISDLYSEAVGSALSSTSHQGDRPAVIGYLIPETSAMAAVSTADPRPSWFPRPQLSAEHVKVYGDWTAQLVSVLTAQQAVDAVAMDLLLRLGQRCIPIHPLRITGRSTYSQLRADIHKSVRLFCTLQTSLNPL